jgi:hypothetical protein
MTPSNHFRVGLVSEASELVERFQTPKGSTVEVSGRWRGIIEIDFDWLEEAGCSEAHPNMDAPDPEDPLLGWSCACHGSGSARMVRVR